MKINAAKNREIAATIPQTKQETDTEIESKSETDTEIQSKPKREMENDIKPEREKDKAKPKMNGRRIESSRPFRQTAFFRLRLLLSKVCL